MSTINASILRFEDGNEVVLVDAEARERIKEIAESGIAINVDPTLSIDGAAADAAKVGEFKNSINIVNPDSYTGDDASKIQASIDDLVASGVGGIIYIGRKYTLNASVVCNLRTDNTNANNDKTFITFQGVGKDAGFEFGSSVVSFKGSDNGSPYGGLRFININFYQKASVIGSGSAFTQMSGLIRTVFDNCRFNGFRNVFDASSAGNASLKIVQNLSCINCYFSNCSDYVLDAYSLGSDQKAPYVYAVNFFSCIIEKCKGLIKGSDSSGYSVWTNVNIENCTIENCTGIPIVFGEGVRGVTISKNYFEKNDYEDSHAHIDLRGLYGTSADNRANVYGIDISNNSFIKGTSSGSYTAHSVGVLLPTYEPWGASDASDLVHGVIVQNVFEDEAFAIESSPNNDLRFKFIDNNYDEPITDFPFYDYPSGIDPEEIASEVTSWLDSNVSPIGSAATVDASLSIQGAAADAKAAGNLNWLDFNKAATVLQNEDFNDYTTPGTYKVPNYSTAKTVSNIPEKIGGRLIVLTTMAAARIVQIYIPAIQTAKFYVRAYYDSPYLWSNWVRLQTGKGDPLWLASADSTSIASGSDFDSYKTPGNFIVGSASVAGNIANCPVNVAGRLTVMETHGAERVKQTYELSREDGATYTRYYNGTSWGAWNLEKGENVLSYWDSAIITAADAINNQRAVTINGTDYAINSGLSGDRFVFTTDSHWTWGAKHTPQVIRKLLNETGDMKIFNGGDIVDGVISNVEGGASATDEAKQGRQSYHKRVLCESKAALDEYGPMYYCIGNHEYMNPNDDVAADFVDWQLTPDEVYRSLVAGMGDKIIDHDAVGDYCFDNVANKIRYFFIASNARATINSASAVWLESALNAMPAGYTAIIISHVAAGETVNTDTGSSHYGEVPVIQTFRDTILPKLKSAKNNGIDIGFVICGHTHKDNYCYADDSGILIISTATDAWKKTRVLDTNGNPTSATKSGFNTMTAGTDTEHCFDVVSFDTTTRVVALTRVGAGASRVFRF